MIKYLILTLLLISTESFSQLIIQGKILEEKTKLPVGYANIRITNSTAGLATDEQGNFQIKINPEFQHENLIISSLGFRYRLISIDSLVQKGNAENIIYMNPYALVLDDVIVKDSKQQIFKNKSFYIVYQVERRKSDRIVSGIVLEMPEKNVAVGVSILCKCPGSQPNGTGTVSNNKGKFNLIVPDSCTQKINFSYVNAKAVVILK